MIAPKEESLPDLVSRVIDSSGITARSVAEEAGIHESALSSYRAGRRIPNRDVLARIASALESRAALLGHLAEEVRIRSGIVTRSFL